MTEVLPEELVEYVRFASDIRHVADASLSADIALVRLSSGDEHLHAAAAIRDLAPTADLAVYFSRESETSGRTRGAHPTRLSYKWRSKHIPTTKS